MFDPLLLKGNYCMLKWNHWTRRVEASSSSDMLWQATYESVMHKTT